MIDEGFCIGFGLQSDEHLRGCILFDYRSQNGIGIAIILLQAEIFDNTCDGVAADDDRSALLLQRTVAEVPFHYAAPHNLVGIE